MPSERTIASIRLQPCDALERSTVFDCGCHLRHADERWSLCVYHDGFEDCVEQADELQASLEQEQQRRLDDLIGQQYRDGRLAYLQALIDAYAEAMHGGTVAQIVKRDRTVAALLAAATPKENNRG